MPPSLAEQGPELLPDRRLERIADQDAVLDHPGLPVLAPSPDRGLKPIPLHIDAGGQQQAAGGDNARILLLPPIVEPLPVRRLAKEERDARPGPRSSAHLGATSGVSAAPPRPILHAGAAGHAVIRRPTLETAQAEESIMAREQENKATVGR
jgi:hypothetical protein